MWWVDAAAQHHAVAWTPASLPGRRFSFIASSGLVDASGAGSVVSGPAQPVLVSVDAAYNNKPTYNFASNKYFLVAVAGAALAYPFTVLWIGDAGDATNNYWVFDTQSGPSVAIVAQGPGSPAGRVYMAASTAVHSGIDGRTKRCGSAVFNGASSSILVSTGTLVNGSAGTVATNNAILVGATPGPTGFWLGTMAEFHILDGTISVGDRASYHAYGVSQYAVAP